MRARGSHLGRPGTWGGTLPNLSTSREIKTNDHFISGAFDLGSDTFKAVARCYRLIDDALELSATATSHDHSAGRISEFFCQSPNPLSSRGRRDFSRRRQGNDTLFRFDPDLDAGHKRVADLTSCGLQVADSRLDPRVTVNFPLECLQGLVESRVPSQSPLGSALHPFNHQPHDLLINHIGAIGSPRQIVELMERAQ